MDPNIMKLLEEDEDETMHSGADVEAFTAALNRDIEGGGDPSSSQPSDSDSAALSQGSSQTSSQLLPPWQASNSSGTVSYQGQQDPNGPLQNEQHSSEMGIKEHGSDPENQQRQNDDFQQQDRPSQDTFHQHGGSQNSGTISGDIHGQNQMQIPDSESQGQQLQNMGNQQSAGTNNQQTRTGNQQAMIVGMTGQQMGLNIQQVSTGVPNQQRVPTGMNNQQTMAHRAVSIGKSNPPSMGAGVSNQQIMTTASATQPSLGMGLSNQQTMSTGLSNQSAMGAGVSNQHAMATGTAIRPAIATGTPNQSATGTGMSNQQAMSTGSSNRPGVGTGIINQQAMATGMANQPAIGTGASNQQAMGTSTSSQQGINPLHRGGKQVPFALLLPVIQPQLDKDRAMQLQTLYFKLKKNEITKDGFVRHMRSIVGDQMLKMAVYKLQSQASRSAQTASTQAPSSSQASAQHQHMQMPSTVQMPRDSHSSAMEGKVEHQAGSQGMQINPLPSSSVNAINQERERPTLASQGLSKQQQQHLHFSQTSFPAYGSTGNNYQPYSPKTLKQGATQSGSTTQGMSAMGVHNRQASSGEPPRMQSGTATHMTNNSPVQQSTVHWPSSLSKEQRNGFPTSVGYVKQEPVDQPNDQQSKSQLPTQQGFSSFSPLQAGQGNSAPGTSKDDSLDLQSSGMGCSPPSSISTSSVPSSTSQMDPNNPLNSRIPSAISPVGAGVNVKTPQKKPLVGQKKPLEAPGASPPSSKKQKVSGAFLDQSIEQLNDVTAVSGVNLREEEEQLFSGPKEDSRVSEASRRVVQEEEERLIFHKVPLQKKLAEIMAKCGLNSVSNDVERCLSLCVEERLRGLISNLIRMSKQRADIEKPRHRTIITSDVREQIMTINKKAREEWEKKQAEAEKLHKDNEPEGSGNDGDKEKDDGRGRSVKFQANKEEDDKMRTTAANVAARAAVGGDDMLSKWQLMAEQARQKREGGGDAAPGSVSGKDITRKPLSNSAKNAKDLQEPEKKGHSTAGMTRGSVRKFGRNQVVMAQSRVVRSISVKDVIAVLEREPQMSRSTLIYRLYEKARSVAVAEQS